MKRTLSAIMLFAAVFITAQTGFAQQKQQPTKGPTAVQPYVDFLKTQHQSPKEYVMGLFERYDVVVIGERTHPEMTQYDFINELIASPEFAEKVGHVITEVGSNNYTAPLNKVLSANYKSEKMFQKDLVKVLRECEQQVLWPRTNFWQLLTTIYKQNRILPKSKHIDISMLNPSWVWPEKITPEQYAIMEEANDKQNYDVIMAENAINALYKLFEGSRKKALVIVNVPHHLKGCKYWPVTAMACISARFPDRVANVKLNNFITRFENGEEQFIYTADGKWDAAFAANGNKPVGFDMAGSPFGVDGFDAYDQRPQIKRDVTYEQMFDGYIFYNPISEMRNGTGIPGLVDEQFIPEMMRRYSLRGFSEKQVMDGFEGDPIKFNNEVRHTMILECNGE